MKKMIFTKYSNERDEKFKIRTSIYIDENGKKVVQKKALSDLSKRHVSNLGNIYKGLKKQFENSKFIVSRINIEDDTAEYDFAEGKALSDTLDECLARKDYKAVTDIIKDYYSHLEAISDIEFKMTKGFLKIFGKPSAYIKGRACSFSDLDLIFNNIIVSKDDTWNVIDYEWSFGFPLPINYIFYRALFYYATSDTAGLYRREVLDLGLFKVLGISEDDLECYKNMETAFQNYVTGCNHPLWLMYPMQENYDVGRLVEKEKSFFDFIDVFYSNGEPFNGENRETKRLNINGINSFEYNIGNATKMLRIDPGNYCCIIKINKFQAVGSTCYDINYHHNGVNIDESRILFSTNDPQIIIDDIHPHTSKIEVEFEHEFFSVGSAIGVSKGLSDRDYFINKENENVATIRDLTMLVKAKEGETDGVRSALQHELERMVTELKKKEVERLALENEVKKVHSDLETTVDRYNNELANKEKELVNKKEELANKENELAGKENELVSKKSELVNKNAQIAELARKCGEIEYNYNNVLNSTCWKITKPIRVVFSPIKLFMANNRCTSLFYKGLWSLKANGIKNTWQRVKLWRLMRKINSQSVQPALNGPSGTEVLNSIPSLDKLKKTIAVHVHLYYVDLLNEFASYLNNIPYEFDLYVSTKKGEDTNKIEKKLKTIKNVKIVDVREAINRGRDIAPLYVQFGEEIEKHDYFLHVHSKKSLFTGKEQYGWRQYSLDSLLGSETLIKKIFYLFEDPKENIGIFYPETYSDMHVIAQDWLANSYNGKVFLESMGIEFDDGLFNYPVGSFFWARTEAFRPIFKKKLKLTDFPEEAGQTDGTLAHVLERAISFVVRAEGYQMAIYDKADSSVAIGKSVKPFRAYFSQTVDIARYYLNQFDVISFDIFDTLITRLVYMPDKMFLLIGNKIKRELNLDIDFITLRKKAEAMAWNRKKAYCNINDIYDEFPNVAKVSKKVSEKIKKIEIKMELQLCVPRLDVLELFNSVKGLNKKIVLVSDMYLTSKEISDMLEKCGYTGYSDLWISCEKGMRKDSGELWERFASVYGSQSAIHVGDNPRSDIQLAGDNKCVSATYYVMNPVTAFKLSKYYERFKRYISATLENSVLLGMIVNGKLFNSPFNINMFGEPIFENAHDLGYSAFGPLFSAFIKWVDEVSQPDETLLFLAREGYLFMKIYENYCRITKRDFKRGKYFLASRRAVSVASIRNISDIEGILAQYYKGTVSNLVKERLGLEFRHNSPDTEVEMPRDLDKVMKLIGDDINDIVKNSEKERNDYLSYIDSICGKNKKIAVVDVGYSGTIQFYLSKLLNRKINGYYLSTYVDKKPEKIGCKCFALYPLLNDEKETGVKIFNKQLFLEAALKAPYGQLVKFEDGGRKAVYKEDDYVSDEISNLQQGIIDFANEYFSLSSDILGKTNIDKFIAEDLFDVALSGDWFSDKVANLFTVQDNYSANGNWVFDVAERKWVVRQNN